ncbi:MAG: YihY/virulence factor BrkB family protein [Melioribacteraceae bacterium]|nr:YihY/virulence factor BrkB family protein [Melioribacteraceae bacterium]
MSKNKIINYLNNIFGKTNLKKIREFFSHYVVGVYHRMDENHLFLAGAGIAYSLLVSIIPLILIIFSVLGNVISFENIEQQLYRLTDTIIPYPEYADYTKQVILQRLPGFIEYKTLAGYLGGLGLLFTSSWLFSSMRSVLNNIFGVPNQKHFFIAMLRDFGMVLLLIFFILLSTFILPTINILIDFADKIEILQIFQISGFQDSIFSITSVLIIFSLFALFYYLIPYEKLGKKIPLVAAFWATLLWEIARSVFGYYVANFLILNKIYGAFLLMVVVAFWIFYSSVLFVLGAEIGQLYRERKESNEKDNAEPYIQS